MATAGLPGQGAGQHAAYGDVREPDDIGTLHLRIRLKAVPTTRPGVDEVRIENPEVECPRIGLRRVALMPSEKSEALSPLRLALMPFRHMLDAFGEVKGAVLDAQDTDDAPRPRIAP